MYYLYRITNLIDNKVYIGQSVKETDRWRQHKYFARQEQPIQYIHHAMKKYGIENFIYEVIVMCENQKDTDDLEKYLIEDYKSCDPNFGYNVARGGEFAWNRGLPKEQQPMFGKHHTQESKEKIKRSNTGKIKAPMSEDQKGKISKNNLGKTRNAGIKNSNAKLTWELVESIRLEFAQGNTSKNKLAKKYEVAYTTIKKIINNETWKK